MMPTEGPTSAAANYLEGKPAATERSREISIGLALLMCMAAYFGLHVLTRSLLSPNLQLDEAEQFILTQDWRLGYGSQPPLYNWIQKAIFAALGANVASLSLLKNATLWSAYAFTFFAALEILAQRRLAALATVSLLFFPQIAWESQRDQSHLVMATAFSAATLFVFVRLLKKPSPGWYAALGAAAAFGFLSKYNYLFLVVALFAAAVIMPRFRKSILDGRILISVAAFLAIASPHIYWMLTHRQAVASQAYKFAMVQSPGAASYFTSCVQMFNAIVGFVGIPLLVFLPMLVMRWKSGARASENEFVALLTRSFWIGSTLAFAVTLMLSVTYVRDRWLQPLLFPLPIVLVGLVAPQLRPRLTRILFGLGAATAVTALLAINGTALAANSLHRAHNLNIPYPALAQELRKAGFQNGTIIANGFLLGGNLKNQFPASRVVVQELESASPPQRPILIAWPMRGEDLPEDFLNFAGNITGIGRRQLHANFIEVPCQNGPRRSEKIGFILLDAPAGKTLTQYE